MRTRSNFPKPYFNNVDSIHSTDILFKTRKHIDIILLFSVVVGLFAIAVFNSSCGEIKNKEQEAIQTMKDATVSEQENQTPDPSGTYLLDNPNIRIELSIAGDSWSSQTTMKSGFGAEADAADAQFESGSISGKDLFDSTGSVKIGTIDNKEITITLGGQRVTLRKQ